MGGGRAADRGGGAVMNTKYEIVEINQTEITVDVSLLFKTEEMFFNATEMAKAFNKDVREFLRSEPVNEYIRVLLNEGISHIKKREDLIRTKKGRKGGTFLHLGMSAKKYRKIHGVGDVREAVSAAELAELERLQRINTGLIEVGMDYQERKDHLIRCHQKELVLLGEVAHD